MLFCIIFGLVKPLNERSRLVVSFAPKITEQRPHQVASSLNFLLVEYSRGGTVHPSVGVDLHAGSNWDSERFRRRQIRNDILGRSGDSSSFLQRDPSTLLIRCRVLCSQKILRRVCADCGRHQVERKTFSPMSLTGSDFSGRVRLVDNLRTPLVDQRPRSATPRGWKSTLAIVRRSARPGACSACSSHLAAHLSAGIAPP